MPALFGCRLLRTHATPCSDWCRRESGPRRSRSTIATRPSNPSRGRPMRLAARLMCRPAALTVGNAAFEMYPIEVSVRKLPPHDLPAHAAFRPQRHMRRSPWIRRCCDPLPPVCARARVCSLAVGARLAITLPTDGRVEIGAPITFQWTAAKGARLYRLLYRRHLGPNETVLASRAPQWLSGTEAPTASPTAFHATLGPQGPTPTPTYGAGVMDVLGRPPGGRRRQEEWCLVDGQLEVDATVRAHSSAARARPGGREGGGCSRMP
jgi:hypothetical protein